MPPLNSRLLPVIAFLLPVVGLRAQTPPNGTLLFQNLQKLSNSFRVDNPAVPSERQLEGPKGLAAGDFDGDGRVDLAAGNHDGTIGVLFRMTAPVTFEPVRHLIAGDPRGLRDVIAANVKGDARPEIIAALANESIFDLTMGFVTAESRASGEPDLLTAVTWSGEVFIRRFLGAGVFPPYPATPQIRLAVPGAPRARSPLRM